MISILLSTLPIPDSQENDTLSNAHFTAVVTPVQGNSRAGSIVELVDVQTGIDFAQGGNYASVHCGDFVPGDGTLTQAGPDCTVFESLTLVNPLTREELPISISVTYRLVNRGLEITYELGATDTAEISVPLEADFGLYPYLGGFIKYANQTVFNDRVNGLSGQHSVFRTSGDQEVILYGPGCPVDTRYFFPNPSKGFIALSAEDYPNNEYMSLRFFDTEPPRSSATGPDLHSRLGPGNYSTYYVRMAVEDDQLPIYFSNHPNGWERTASWIMDEIPLLHPNQGNMWGFSETSGGNEWVSAWLIQMLEDHPSMSMNVLILPDGILEGNCDSMWYEPGQQDSWSHWHSTWRVSTEAPEDYLQWLQNIQNDVYPWSDRMNLGCHGYHHTPSPDSAWDPYHEFITYEPAEHQERFDMIQSDYTDIGLDPEKTSRTMRPSGNEISLSGLWAMIDHGFEYYSNGARWWEWQAGEWFYDLYLTKYETPGHRIWGANTVWWADYQMLMDHEKLTTVLNRGKHSLLGGHPLEIFGDGQQAAYDRIDSVCTSLEEDYPYFGWLMPVDFSSFMEELYCTRIDSIRSSWSSAGIYFHGSTGNGQTVVCKLPDNYTDLNVTVNGSPADWEDHGENRVFIDVDGLSQGSHSVNLNWNIVGINEDPPENGNRLRILAPSPSTGSTVFTVTGLSAASLVEVTVLDISGRIRTKFTKETDGSGSFSSALNLPDGTPAGVYFISISCDGRGASSRLVLLE